LEGETGGKGRKIGSEAPVFGGGTGAGQSTRGETNQKEEFSTTEGDVRGAPKRLVDDHPDLTQRGKEGKGGAQHTFGKRYGRGRRYSEVGLEIPAVFMLDIGS